MYEEANSIISAKTTIEDFINNYVRQCISPYWHLEKIWQVRNALRKFFDPKIQPPKYVVDMRDRITKDLEANNIAVKDFIQEKIKTYGDWSRFAQLYEKHCAKRSKKPDIICKLVLKKVPKVDQTFKSILTSISDEMSKHNLNDTVINKETTDSYIL